MDWKKSDQQYQVDQLSLLGVEVATAPSFARTSTPVTPRERFERLWPWLALVLVLAVSLGLRSRYLWVQELSTDEGHWLMFGALVNGGYSAYTVTFVGIPPLALLAIQAGSYLFGASLGVRYPMMLFSLVGIGSIFWLMQPWKNRVNGLAGLLAAIFLSFETEYFHASCSIMAEVPAVAVALLSLALAWQYSRDRRYFWLVLSGGAFVLSLALKVFMIFLPAVIGLLLAFVFLAEYRERRTIGKAVRQAVIAGGSWLAGVLITLAVFLMVYDYQAMIHQVVVFRLALREAMVREGQAATLGENIGIVSRMLAGFSPLIAGALIGLIVSWRQQRNETWMWLTWLVLGVLLLISHLPVRGRYSVMVLPPLAALSGIAAAYGLTKLSRWLSCRRPMTPGKASLEKVALVVPLLGIIVWAVTTPFRSALLPTSPGLLGHDTSSRRLEAIEYIRKNTTGRDCIVTDDQRVATMAGRLVPPFLSETTHARLLTGWLTMEEVLAQIEQYDCPAVVYADRKFIFDLYLPNLRPQLHHLYFAEIPFNNNTTVYIGKKDVGRQPEIPVTVDFGQLITLKGIDLSPARWQADKEAQVATYWSALKPIDRDYKIFLQLRNQHHETVLSADHFPFPAPGAIYEPVPTDQQYQAVMDLIGYPATGMLPTRAWVPNRLIREVATLSLPASLPAGTYSLYVGLYEPDTLTRLLVPGTLETGDEFLVTSVEVEASN